jgi:hypothetical protein
MTVGTGRHELQIPVHQSLTQPVTNLARPRHKPHKTRKGAHLSTIPASDTRARKRHGSPVYYRRQSPAREES